MDARGGAPPFPPPSPMCGGARDEGRLAVVAVAVVVVVGGGGGGLRDERKRGAQPPQQFHIFNLRQEKEDKLHFGLLQLQLGHRQEEGPASSWAAAASTLAWAGGGGQLHLGLWQEEEGKHCLGQRQDGHLHLRLQQ